jgi:hypothetical protein
MAGTEREAELGARIAALEARLAELEAGGRAAGPRGDAEGGEPMDSMESMVGLMTGLLPSEVRGHLRSARREQLLAARAMIDHWIARVDRKPPERRRRESIRLDLE